jgi:uncharacterized protein YjiS (DUF1127 family)
MEAKMHAPTKLNVARIDCRSLSAEHQQALVPPMTRDAHAAPARLIRTRFRRLRLRLANAMASARNAVLHLASHSLAALIRWQQSQRAMTELAALSDRELKDLGMHRSHILWVANHGRHDPLASLIGKGGPDPRPIPISARPHATRALPRARGGGGRAA